VERFTLPTIVTTLGIFQCVASMRPRRGTPWKGLRRRAISVASRTHGASMRPRRGTPWKGDLYGCNIGAALLHAPRRGRGKPGILHLAPGVLQCGHGGELRGKDEEWSTIFRRSGYVLKPASMRPRRGTPWKGRTAPSGLNCAIGGRRMASMRPRRGTPWKDERAHVCSLVLPRCSEGFNAATEGNSVERAPWKAVSLLSPKLQCGHGGELRGKPDRASRWLPARGQASMRPRRGTPWKANSWSRGAGVDRLASMRPRRGTPWKAPRRTPRNSAAAPGLQCGHGGELRGKLDHPKQTLLPLAHASMRPRRGTPWKDR
jgi:hypothetical protein